MTKLNHERVVKLLGVILDDGDYSLVLELIPKGNLQAMLDQVRPSDAPIEPRGAAVVGMTGRDTSLLQPRPAHIFLLTSVSPVPPSRFKFPCPLRAASFWRSWRAWSICQGTTSYTRI